mmetsp:Transcript_11969/g.32210  ORF Transcript_11969/g.32210 Transcript_11969/m.32210 type:complete len:228 (-) Transcript_11969:1602-2285(-)
MIVRLRKFVELVRGEQPFQQADFSAKTLLVHTGNVFEAAHLADRGHVVKRVFRMMVLREHRAVVLRLNHKRVSVIPVRFAERPVNGDSFPAALHRIFVFLHGNRDVAVQHHPVRRVAAKLLQHLVAEPFFVQKRKIWIFLFYVSCLVGDKVAHQRCNALLCHKGRPRSAPHVPHEITTILGRAPQCCNSLFLQHLEERLASVHLTVDLERQEVACHFIAALRHWARF